MEAYRARDRSQPIMSTKKAPPRKKLDVGQIIMSERDSYKIESILGSGGFGDVYKVVSQSKPGGPPLAIKTEYFDDKMRKNKNRLKIEIGVFHGIEGAPQNRRKHFIRMLDKGKTELFKYIVMDIVSYSIEDIRRYMMEGVVTWPTAIRIGLQTLSSISDLHSLGFLHRDIKPHNFAIGCPPNNTNIYMLDFGIARRYLDKDGKIRIPRATVSFLGTIKFASRASHREKEQARKDDIEMWMYMVLELFDKANLVWTSHTDRAQILLLKERLFTSTGDMGLKMPSPFMKIINHIKALNFADEPNYDQYGKILWECAHEQKLDMACPLDWIGKAMPEKKKPPPVKKDRLTAAEKRQRRREKEDEKEFEEDVKEVKEPEKKDEKGGDECRKTAQPVPSTPQ